MIRTLLDRGEAITSKPEERKKEEEHVYNALKCCGYPDWAFKQVKEQRALTPEEKAQRREEKQKPAEQSLGQVSLPYVAGLSEAYARLLKKHRIQSCMKPYNTLRENLVHPKDKRDITENAGVLYNIPCKQCPRVYIGETGRRLGVRLKEHRDDVNKNTESVPYTRSQRIASESIDNKPALTDHATRINHTIDWDSTTIVGREDQRLRRQIRETIRIRQETRPLNRDKGNYDLPPLWGPLLIDAHRSTGTTHGSAVQSQLLPNNNNPMMAAEKSSRKSYHK